MQIRKSITPPKASKIIRKPFKTLPAASATEDRPQLLKRFRQIGYEFIDWKAILKNDATIQKPSKTTRKTTLVKPVVQNAGVTPVRKRVFPLLEGKILDMRAVLK